MYAEKKAVLREKPVSLETSPRFDLSGPDRLEQEKEAATFFGIYEYAIVKGFYPRELIEPYCGYIGEHLKKAHEIFDNLPPEEERSEAQKHVAKGHFPTDVRLSEKIYPIAQFVNGSGLIQACLGSTPQRMHMPPMIRFIPSNYLQAMVPAHQDIGYNSHMSHFITIWTPLVTITEQCGGIRIGDEHISDMDIGDGILLSPYNVHASMPNMSDRTRLSVDLRFFGAKDTSSKHYLEIDTLQVVAP